MPRRLVVILAMLSAFGPLATDMYLSAFVDMRADLHTDAAGVGASLSTFLLGLAIGQIVYGPLSDRFGRRPLLLAGAGLFAVASALCAGSHDGMSFTLLRLVQALGACSGITLARAMVRDLYEPRRIADLFSILSMVSMAAPLIAPSMGVAIIRLAGWRAIFLFLAGMGVACCAAIWWVLPESLPPARRTPRLRVGVTVRAFGAVLAQPRFLLAALTTGCASGILFAFITGSSTLLMGHYGITRASYGCIFTLVISAMIGGGLLNRRLLKRHDGVAIVRIAGLVAVATAFAMVIASGHDICLLCAALAATVGMLGLMLPGSAAAAISSVEGAGVASSVLGVLQFGTGFLASAIVAFVQQRSVAGTAVSMLGFALAGSLSWRGYERKLSRWLLDR